MTMDLEQYLDQTKYAVDQLLQNLKFYDSLYRDLVDANRKTKSIIFDDYISDPDHPNFEEEFKRWQTESEDGHREFSAALARLEGARVLSNAISGAILQIAFMGIKIYSRNEKTPNGCEPLFIGLKPRVQKPLKKMLITCVTGRENDFRPISPLCGPLVKRRAVMC